MSTARRSIRMVLDAGYDLNTAETINGSIIVGHTTNPVQIATNVYGMPAFAYSYYISAHCDSTTAQPHMDQVVLSAPNFPTWHANFNPASGSVTNCGLKHYQHQMQSMKGSGTSYGVVTGGDILASAPSATNIISASAAGGTFKQANISMGGMRGFKYHTQVSAFWYPSSGGSSEHLEKQGSISIGDTA